MAEWQPIDTAPRDGTVVLVYPPTFTSNGQTCSAARFDDDRYSQRPRPCWKRDDAIHITTSRDKPPTHWMPMPAPPGEPSCPL